MKPLDKEALNKTVRQKMSNKKEHMFNSLSKQEQDELIEVFLKGQGYYIREGIKEGVDEIALPGLGTFVYNKLKNIANQIRESKKDELYEFQIRELVKSKLISYVKEHGNPMRKKKSTLGKITISNNLKLKSK